MATQEGKGRGEGRGVLKPDREMKADFSPSPLFKKKKKMKFKQCNYKKTMRNIISI